MRLRSHTPVIRRMSRQKKISTASMVPSWMTAVNAAPGSCQPASFGTMSRCAELEIGRNSVSPWTMPRMTASKTFTVGQLRASDTIL